MEHRKSRGKNNTDDVTLLICSGEGSCFVRAGITPGEEMKALDDRIDKLCGEELTLKERVLKKIRK